MPTGDDNWALVSPPNTAPCGCYVGIWHGVTPPPRCDRHRNGFITQPWVEPGAQDAAQIAEEFLKQLSQLKQQEKEPPLDVRIADTLHEVGHVEQQIDVVLKAIGDGNPAARDAWLLVREHLEPLRAAIERAREVTEGE